MKTIMVDWCILITIDYIFQIPFMSRGGNMMGGLQVTVSGIVVTLTTLFTTVNLWGPGLLTSSSLGKSSQEKRRKIAVIKDNTGVWGWDGGSRQPSGYTWRTASPSGYSRGRYRWGRGAEQQRCQLVDSCPLSRPHSRCNCSLSSFCIPPCASHDTCDTTRTSHHWDHPPCPPRYTHTSRLSSYRTDTCCIPSEHILLFWERPPSAPGEPGDPRPLLWVAGDLYL